MAATMDIDAIAKDIRRKKAEKWVNTPKWEPVEWRPEYELIVRDDILGLTNNEIALKSNLSAMHVGNILRSKQAVEFRKQAVDAIRSTTMSIIENQMKEIANKSVANIHHVLHDEKLLTENPMQIFDRSVVALKGLGKMVDADAKINNSSTVTNNTQVIINQVQENNIIGGIEELKKIAALHKGVDGASIN